MFGSGFRGWNASRNGAAVIDTALLQEVRAYWEGLRDHGALPSRATLDPRGIASALENVVLLERIAPGHARFRLAGHFFHDLMGMDVRGMPLSALFDPLARQKLQPLLEELFAAPLILSLSLQAERTIGQPAFAARMLLLPMTGYDGSRDMALGVVAGAGRIGRAPRRFHIETASTEALRLPTAPAPAPAAARAPARGLAEAAAPPPRARPALRLVHSRD